MPKLKRTRWALPVFAVLVAGLLIALHALVASTFFQSAVLAGALLVLFAASETDLKKRRLALSRLAATREGQSICEFARDFDARHVDTWVIRAVHESLQAELSHFHPGFPVRASDRLLEDLQLDSDDLDMVVAVEVEQRTGRSLENVQNNPYYGRVKTVGDLVLCFQAQPADTTRRVLNHPVSQRLAN
jgi:hypothetical protein